MAKFTVSARAKAKLVEIYEFTEIRFGQYQADAYQAGFERTFGLLADFPRMGTEADNLKVGFRRFRFQSHFVFYTIENDGVVVRNIIHVGQNIRPSLIE
jgi:toxin ParE1/3/4